MNLRVLHLLEGLDRGGTETLVLDLARAASAAEMDLTVLATGSGALASEFAALGPRFVAARRRAPIDPLLVRRIRRLLSKERIDVVHAHQAVTGMHGYLAARGTRTRCCLSFHGHQHQARKDVAALSYLLPRVDRRIVVSAGFLDRLRRQLPAARGAQFDLVYNGIDTARLDIPIGNPRSELGLPSNALLLGMVGNFQPWKDQPTICRALPRVFAQIPTAHFLFIGAPSRSDIHLLCRRLCRDGGIEDRVHFLGARSDVPALLPALDLFVFSSLEDTFGIAAIEAMLSGVSCVVSDIPPLIEVTGNGAAAVLFRVGNDEELATALIRLLTDEEERHRWARIGRDWAKERFGITRHARALAELYSALRGSER